MHKEKIKIYDPVKKEWFEVEAVTFDTVVHLTKGTKHALKDIERLLGEEAKETK
jgi:hypothetical protein